MDILERSDLVSRLQTGDAKYACYSFGDLSPENQKKFLEERDEYEAKAPWSKIMKDVPHLKLNIPEFDAERALLEIEQHIDFMVPINMRNDIETEEKGPDDHHSWSARALINYTPHDDRWFQKQSKECATRAFPEYQPYAHSIINSVPRLNLEDMKYYKTPLWDKLSYITDYISTYLCDESYRAFVWQMGKEGYLNWHNHARLPWHSDLITNDKAIVHIPVVTHDDIKMLVEIDDVIYSENYKAGGTYIFNNIHDHAVENNTSVNRIHIAIFIPWHDKKFTKVLERSYENNR
jgi:hypothetical protein